jgi:hypothetical protein
LKPHEEQQRLWDDQTRFKIVPAGRRSGKTELAKRRLVEHLFRKTFDRKPGRYFAAAPTLDQARRIFWEDLKRLIPRRWVRNISETLLRIQMKNGSELHVVGLEVPQRIEGSPWDGCVIDELADCPADIWDAHIRPALADRRGWAWLIGVPDMHAPAQAKYEKLVNLAQGKTDPEWRCFSWPSADILPPEEVESARRQLDENIFRQEYFGEFVIAQGRAFKDFNPAVHVKPTPYDPALEICWSLDFNINPMCSGVLQHHQGKVRVIDELALRDTDTFTACDAFLERAQSRGWNLKNLKLYGDASGNARDTTSGRSDWKIILDRLRDFSPVKKLHNKNPWIKDTINAVRGILRSAGGEVRLSIDPRCARLIDDLRSAIWPSDLSQQHALAWFRYFIEYQYPVRPLTFNLAGTVAFSTAQPWIPP